MKRLLIKTLAGSGLLLMSLTASGQYYPRPDYRQVQDERDAREAREHNRVLERVRSDLDRAHAGTLPLTADRSRVVKAREGVRECERILMAGDYDRRQFDEVIVSIQRVADLNRLSDLTGTTCWTTLETCGSCNRVWKAKALLNNNLYKTSIVGYFLRK